MQIDVGVPGLGTLRGIAREGIAEFLNVQYGKIKQRFDYPSLARGGIEALRDCTRQGPLCPQVAPYNDDYNGVPSDECAPLDLHYDEFNCLNMRVCLPLNSLPQPDSSSPLIPVVVWLHGGSNIAGSPYRGSSDASSFIRKCEINEGQPFIFIAPHYRVGLFGWNPVIRGGKLVTNQAIADQRLVLQWIHQYGKYIGADASKITFVGQSAGATDTYAHLQTSESVDLCNQFALLSGHYSFISLQEAEKLNRVVCEHLNTSDLTTVSADALVKAQTDLGVTIMVPIDLNTNDRPDLKNKSIVISDCVSDGDFFAESPALVEAWKSLPPAERMDTPEHYFTNLVFTSPANDAASDLLSRHALVYRQLCDGINPYSPEWGNNHMVELHYIINGYKTKPHFDEIISAVQKVWCSYLNYKQPWLTSKTYVIPQEGLPYVELTENTRANGESHPKVQNERMLDLIKNGK